MDALSATGLRSIRYALECDSLLPVKIIANDVSKKAIEAIEKNIETNDVKDKVVCNQDDASYDYILRFPDILFNSIFRIFMYRNRGFKSRFSIIDLDPYGSPAPFLDAAVQALADGGLLMVTCTDMAVLCGNHSETCHAKYGSVCLKSKCCHEMVSRVNDATIT